MFKHYLTVAVIAVLLSCSCSRSGSYYSYALMSPQMSAENRFIGRDIEIGFTFGASDITLTVKNTSDNPIAFDTDNSYFVDIDGRKINVIPADEDAEYNTNPGSKSTFAIGLAEYGCGERDRLWHRRNSLRKNLVCQSQLRPDSSYNIVKFHLSFHVWDRSELGGAIDLGDMTILSSSSSDLPFDFEFAVVAGGQ